MTLPITVAMATISIVSLGILLLVRLLGSDNPVLPVTTEWLTELSTDRYLPMLRLLDDADFQFLQSQKGFTAEMASSLRRRRVHAFRGYLRLLEADFARAAAALQVILAHSACDRPELAFLVFQRRLTFALAINRHSLPTHAVPRWNFRRGCFQPDPPVRRPAPGTPHAGACLFSAGGVNPAPYRWHSAPAGTQRTHLH